MSGPGPIQTFPKRDPAGAPFVAGSADNGLSIDTVTGRVVLGNDSLGVAGLAQLLSNREIFTNGFSITLVDGNIVLTIAPGQVSQVDNATNSAATMNASGSMSVDEVGVSGPFYELNAALGLQVHMRLRGGEMFIETPNNQEFRIVMANGNVLIGGALVDNGSKLQVDGHVSMLTATANLDFPNTAAQTSSDLTIALAGAAINDMAVVGLDPAGFDANSCYTAFVDAPGSVTVRFNNYSAAAINPAARDFTVSILKRL